LRLGRERFDIRFWREGKETQWEVLKGDAAVVERETAPVVSVWDEQHAPA
jgi:hypothetical protein